MIGGHIYGAKRMTRNGQCFSFQHGNVSALNAMIKFQTSLQFAIISYISLAKSLAGIQTNGNYPIERPVASQSYLAPQQTNKQTRERDATYANFAFQKRQQIINLLQLMSIKHLQ